MTPVSVEDLSWLADTTSFTPSRYIRYPEEKTVQQEMFFFDPNTLGEEGWLRLGIKPFIARNIEKYRLKGGQFKHPDDLSKIYGLTPDEVSRLLPYVQIKNSLKGGEREINEKNTSKQAFVLDINLADSAAWESLRGIGPKLASRIVHFRERLGGFYSIAQVGETYGLPDSTFQKIKSQLKISNHFILKQIDVNSVGVNELKQHPYIRYNNARLIVAFREAHGKYKQASDFASIIGLDSVFLNKAGPYLSFGDRLENY